jgi:hypothetical protein
MISVFLDCIFPKREPSEASLEKSAMEGIAVQAFIAVQNYPLSLVLVRPGLWFVRGDSSVYASVLPVLIPDPMYAPTRGVQFSASRMYS